MTILLNQDKMNSFSMLSRLLAITLLVSANVYAHEHDEGSEYHHYDHDHAHGLNGYNMTFSSPSNSDDGGDTKGITPPSPFDKAATARWLIHNTVWGALSTITDSSRDRPGSPFANIASHSQ